METCSQLCSMAGQLAAASPSPAPTASSFRNDDWDLSPLESIEILVLELFAGIGPLGIAFEQLMIKYDPEDSIRSMIIMFETDLRCRRCLLGHRRSSRCMLSSVRDAHGLQGSAFALTDDDGSLVKLILNAAPRVRWILIAGGPACQPFSSVGSKERVL